MILYTWFIEINNKCSGCSRWLKNKSFHRSLRRIVGAWTFFLCINIYQKKKKKKRKRYKFYITFQFCFLLLFDNYFQALLVLESPLQWQWEKRKEYIYIYIYIFSNVSVARKKKDTILSNRIIYVLKKKKKKWLRIVSRDSWSIRSY